MFVPVRVQVRQLMVRVGVRSAAAWAGALLLVLQLVGYLVLHLRVRLVTGPTKGEVLSLPRMRSITDGHEITTSQLGGGCLLLVFVNSQCPICSHMRHSWYPRWRATMDSIQFEVLTVWLTAELPSSAERIVSGGMIPKILFAHQLPGQGNTWRRLGVYGTPTTYLLDGTMRLRYGLAGAGLPPASVLRGVCGAK